MYKHVEYLMENETIEGFYGDVLYNLYYIVSYYILTNCFPTYKLCYYY